MDFSSLTTRDLRHIYDCLQDQISTQMELWERGKHQDHDLDAYIDVLCDVRDKLVKILRTQSND